MTDSDLESLDSSKETINLDYIKSNFFRVIYVDGAMVNLSGEDNINLVIWNQRGAIPSQETYLVDSDGFIGEQISSVSKEGIVREIEANIVLNRESALSLKRLLEDILSE